MKKMINKAVAIDSNRDEPVDININKIDAATILNQLCYKKFEDNIAKEYMEQIEKHQTYLAKKLEREVDFIVAAVDYFTINNIFDELRIIEKNIVDDLSRIAVYDNLTGLYKREVFDALLKKEIEKRQRLNDPLVLIMLDIDDFKIINDTYGHLEGDDVLRKLGSLITENSRSYDIECRYGGEEIAIILPEADIEIAYQFSERLREIIIKRFKDKDYKVTVSIGIAKLDKTDDLIYLIKKADEALYYAKQHGKNQSQIYNTYK